MDLHVAEDARLLLGRLLRIHYRETGFGRGAKMGCGMALQALQVDVAVLQHVRICPSMRNMAGRASRHSHGSMLEHEGPLLVSVALETHDIAGI